MEYYRNKPKMDFKIWSENKKVLYTDQNSTEMWQKHVKIGIEFKFKLHVDKLKLRIVRFPAPILTSKPHSAALGY